MHRTPPTSPESLDFDPCSHVAGVESDGFRTDISFSDPFPGYLNDSIHTYFAYQTSAFDLPLFVRPGIPKVLSFTERSLSLHFPLPFVSNYSGFLICINPRTFQAGPFGIPRDVLGEAESYLPLNFAIDDFLPDTPWSQLKCFGSSFETRFCEMRRVSLFQTIFLFSTEVDYIFPEPFLCGGGRAAPFDRLEGRLTYEPVVIHSPIEMVTNESEHVSELSYIISRFHNSFMLWHTLFDFMVPAFYTFSLIEGAQMSSRRRIFIRDNDFLFYPEMLQALSDFPIIPSLTDETTRAFERVVVGLAKKERNPSAAREYEEMLSIEYDYDGDTAPMLRSEAFKAINWTSPPLDPHAPVVLFIERTTKSRRLLNMEEIEQYVLDRCDFCEINRVDFKDMPVAKQIETVSKATVMIGVHGSGLAHVLWLKERSELEPTAVIEIFPYAYTCRDWFESAAAVARVKYYRVATAQKLMPPNLTRSETESLETCWASPELCHTNACHDQLRDQNVSLEIGAFSSAWMSVVRDLRRAQTLSVR
jgi:hypothetical protein